MYDLNLIPIHLIEGNPHFQLPGFQAAGPPRRAARSRSEDLLILSLTLGRSDWISPETQQSWLDRLTQVYFKSTGSVTSALRALIETLNLTMMEKNLKMAKGSGASTGSINLAAVHRRHLYIVQSGFSHAFTLTHQGLQHFYDASQSDRGLGLSRTPTVRYYQADLGTGGYFFMTDKPPETWTDDLLFSNGYPSLEQLRRRLLNQAPSDFRLDLVQIIPGEGEINLIQPVIHSEQAQDQGVPEGQLEAESLDSAAVSEASVDEAVNDPGVNSDTQEVRTPSARPQLSEDDNIGEPVAGDQPQSEIETQALKEELDRPSDSVPQNTSSQPLNETSTPGGFSERQSRSTEASKLTDKDVLSKRKEEIREKSLRGLGEFLKGWHDLRETVGLFFKDLLARFAPSSEENPPQLSSRTRLIIAIVVPLVVVAIAVGVYLGRGRTLQYQYYYEQAELTARNALAADDPTTERREWAQTLLYIDQAESFRGSDELIGLRREAEIALDRLDGAVRLAYRPAIIGALYSDISITRIVSYGSDLYLLDSSGGRVIHATSATQGFEVNTGFVCAAGNFSGGRVDMLVDMVALPINNPYQAHILAVDASGNVAYCAPGQDPVVQSLPSPNGHDGEIIRIAYEGNFLYVLNPAAGSVRVYRHTNGQFLDPPSNFFDGVDVGDKPDISQIVDLAVNGPELYFLRTDGLMVDCVYSGLPANPVNCENPVPYVDGRPGMEDQLVLMPDSNYVAVHYTSPPDPSVSILDAPNADIYRFSLRFRLHQRLRPDLGNYEIETPTATAFTIGIDRVAFIAFGHQVFYAYVD
jgi:hypothetical protein